MGNSLRCWFCTAAQKSEIQEFERCGITACVQVPDPGLSQTTAPNSNCVCCNCNAWWRVCCYKVGG